MSSIDVFQRHCQVRDSLKHVSNWTLMFLPIPSRWAAMGLLNQGRHAWNCRIRECRRGFPARSLIQWWPATTLHGGWINAQFASCRFLWVPCFYTTLYRIGSRYLIMFFCQDFGYLFDSRIPVLDCLTKAYMVWRTIWWCQNAKCDLYAFKSG